MGRKEGTTKEGRNGKRKRAGGGRGQRIEQEGRPQTYDLSAGHDAHHEERGEDAREDHPR